MRLAPGQREFQPPQALTVSDDADVLVFGLKDRALLDMVFEIGMHPAGADLFVADPADAFQFIAEGLSFRILAAIGEVLAVHAGKDAGGEHGRREACAFLVRPVGNDDRVLGLDAEVVHRANDFEAGEHAQHTVELAAGRLGVEMRTDIDGQSVRVGAGACEEHVAHTIDAHGEAGRLAPGLEQPAPFGVRVGQCLAVIAASNARADLGHFHK
ncbi:hypothetical protein D9M72_530330 [compost metagenome]